MNRLLWKGLALAALNVLLGAGILAAHDARLVYQPWETDSVLLLMPRGEATDTVLLGSSHAYLFSRFEKNHAMLQETLGPEVFNMAMPTGGGALPARLYFEYFFEQGNSAKQLLYFLDPFVLFNEGSNEYHKFVYYEPFEAGFFLKILRNSADWRRAFTYVRSKFGAAWFFQKPEPLIEHPHALTAEDVRPDRVQARIDSLYTEGMPEDHFARYCAEVERILALCGKHGVEAHLLIPPTLLGPEPGAEQMLAWLREIQSQYAFHLHDLSGSTPDPKYYYNLDHLNTAGVGYFLREVLMPALDQSGHVAGA